MAKKRKVKPEKKVGISRPPVVAVLGHVDHGKTTLLDKIRETDIAGDEFGGITQKIGASRVYIDKDKTKWITFVDTPGHEAFGEMRARGGKVADMAILVVAANDSVKPQTVESIGYIRDAKIPFIVVINKIDLEGVIINKVKKDLAKEGVSVEGMGGDVVCVEVSAKTGKGIKELLEMIMLVSEMQNLEYNDKGELEAVVVESARDKRRGTLVTILVKQGFLKVGDGVEVEGVKGKIKAMVDEHGEKKLKK